MTPTENKQLLKHVFAETATGNGRPFVEALSENVWWRIIGSTGWSKKYEGRKAVLTELLGPLNAQLAHANTIIADRFIAEDDWVVVQAKGRNLTKSGLPYENEYCWVIRMSEGRMTEITEYADTQLFVTALVSP